MFCKKLIMGSNYCKMCKGEEEEEKITFILNNFLMDFKGKYNYYSEYSSFEIDISKKKLNQDQFEIEGLFVDKMGKSTFSGKISQTEISIDTKLVRQEKTPHELNFKGKYDIKNKKYFGIIKKKFSKSRGKFWMNVKDNNFWTETALTSKES